MTLTQNHALTGITVHDVSALTRFEIDTSNTESKDIISTTDVCNQGSKEDTEYRTWRRKMSDRFLVTVA
jgi:hypothetical protein